MEPKSRLSSKNSLESFLEKIESLSKLQRILISAGIFLLAIGIFVYVFCLPKFKTIQSLDSKLDKLTAQLKTAKQNAAALEAFQDRMKEAEAQFKAAMKALPEKEEIPSLLTGISKSGQDVGLEFLLFEPKPEVRQEFYAEIPVAITVKGTYHDLAMFFDKVARLSRIVNIKDIAIDQQKEDHVLTASCTALTYKFIEAPPKSETKDKGAAKKKRSSTRKKKKK
jgi:type IV pilus assembly protein PilO